jgi:hypothetical protein
VITCPALDPFPGAAVDYASADVLDRDAFLDNLNGEIDTILGLFYALLALAVVIALLGIANTLALSIFERTRELGLLRAVGMNRSRGQPPGRGGHRRDRRRTGCRDARTPGRQARRPGGAHDRLTTNGPPHVAGGAAFSHSRRSAAGARARHHRPIAPALSR